MDETLLGRTTRVVTFVDKCNTIRMVRKPAGTFVYVTATKQAGVFRVRVPQTLLEQDVYLSAVEPV